MDRVFATTKWLAEHRLAVLGFAVAAGFWPTFLQAAFAPRWIVIAVGVPLLFSIDPRNIPESMRWLLVWMLSLALISTTFASPDPLTGYYDLIFVVILGLTFIAAASLETIDDIMAGLATGLAISSVLILLNLHSDDGRGTADLGALFFNSEVLAEFAALVFIWGVTRPDIWIAAVSVIPLALCNSRISILAAAVGILYAYRPRSWVKTLALMCGLAVMAVLTVFAFGIPKIGSFEHRLTLWIATVFAWNQYGHGLGWFLTSYPLEQFAHSDAIQVIAELGVGAFALAALPIMIFWNKGGTNAERALFLAVCLEVFVSFPLHMPATGFVAAIVAGRLVGAGYRVRLGELNGRVENGVSIRRTPAADRDIAGQRGRIGGAVSAGPVFATSEAVRSRENPLYPRKV